MRANMTVPELLLWLLGPPPPLPEYAREEETGVPRPSCGGKPGGGPGLLLLRELDGVQRWTGALSRESLCSLLPLLTLLSLRAGADNAGIGVGSSQGLMMVWGTDVAGTRPAEAGGLGCLGGSCAGCTQMNNGGNGGRKGPPMGGWWTFFGDWSNVVRYWPERRPGIPAYTRRA